MKRTERLKREEEVALPHLGKDVWTTRGDIELTGEEKEELIHNIREQKREEAIQRAVEDVLQAIQVFTAQTFMALAPKAVLEAYTRDGIDAWPVVAWIAENDFHTYQDGLRSVAKFRGNVMGDCMHNVPEGVRDEVRRRVMGKLYA